MLIYEEMKIILGVYETKSIDAYVKKRGIGKDAWGKNIASLSNFHHIKEILSNNRPWGALPQHTASHSLDNGFVLPGGAWKSISVKNILAHKVFHCNY